MLLFGAVAVSVLILAELGALVVVRKASVVSVVVLVVSMLLVSVLVEVVGSDAVMTSVADTASVDELEDFRLNM